MYTIILRVSFADNQPQKIMGKQTFSAGCGVQLALGVIGGKWKLVVLHYLADGQPRRYKELERLIGDITPRMLVKELKELEAHGILHRQAYATVPPTVEYTLTAYGHTLVPVLTALENWGLQHGQRQAAAVS